MKKNTIFLLVLIFLALIIGNMLFLIKSNKLNKKFIFLAEELAFNGCEKSQIKLSSDSSQLGYFIDLNCLNQNKYIDYDNHTSLRVVDLNKLDSREIYKGNYHTSSWEWLNNNEAVVYIGCGTECMAAFIIDANTGEQKVQLQYGVDYEWAPNKEMVLAYNYSAGYGITVGDKGGNELFALRREPPDTYNNFVDKTKALWSPDSSKLALIIKKENIDEMEMVVFKTENFEKILQADVNFAENAEFIWQENDMVSYNNVEFVTN